MLRWITMAIGLACGVSPAAAQEYDDPAVAVCEWELKNTKIPPEAEYRRESASIDGSTVIITYSTSVLKTRPIEADYACEFEEGEGGFIFAYSPPPDISKECAGPLARHDHTLFLQSTGTPVDPELYRETKAEADECISRAKEAMRGIAAYLDAYTTLSSMGIYPIDPEMTELSVE